MQIFFFFFYDDCVLTVTTIAQKFRECNNKKLNLNKETQEGRDS
jgi:hypothetical protein